MDVMLALRVLVALAVVVASVLYLARRLGSNAADASREAQVRVLDRQSLSRHAGLAVVAAGERRLLVGFSDQNVALVTELAPVPQLLGPLAADTPARRAPVGRGASVARPAVPRPGRPAPALPAAGLPGNRRPGLLAGSVLSPGTWQATVRAMQDRTVRR